ncbi:MAG: hypothetical protein WBQ10_13560 [Terriglobales bacterium]
MKKKGIGKSRGTVRIDAEQMEYLRYYHQLTGQRIADILRDMIAQWVAVEYATRIPTLEKTEGAKKPGKTRVTKKKS